MINVFNEGATFEAADKVAIMIHGRGGTVSSILALRDYLNLDGFALILPQAKNNTWYPFSFMSPDHTNQPALSEAILELDEIVKDLYSNGFKSEQIYFIGFSQGACLALEYAARNANKYGGVIAFTGGLIGENLDSSKYVGDFAQAPIFIGSSEADVHVPLSRINESVALLEGHGAKVTKLIFADRQHTIRHEEVDWVNENILTKSQTAIF